MNVRTQLRKISNNPWQVLYMAGRPNPATTKTAVPAAKKADVASGTDIAAMNRAIQACKSQVDQALGGTAATRALQREVAKLQAAVDDMTRALHDRGHNVKVPLNSVQRQALRKIDDEIHRYAEEMRSRPETFFRDWSRDREFLRRANQGKAQIKGECDWWGLG